MTNIPPMSLTLISLEWQITSAGKHYQINIYAMCELVRRAILVHTTNEHQNIFGNETIRFFENFYVW